MVSRVQFFCPGCGAPEKPVLMLTPFYTCPGCNETIPREQLDRQRRNCYVLAGTSPSPFAITNLGTFSDSGGSGSVATPNFQFTTGDLFVAIVADASSPDSGPTTIQLNGSDALTKAVGTTGGGGDPGIAIFTFSGTLTVPGPQSLSLTYVSAPTDIVISMFSIKGAASSPVDKTKVVQTQSLAAAPVSFTTGATTALTNEGELAIGGVACNPDTLLTLTNSFVRGQQASSANLKLIDGRRQLIGKSAVTFTGSCNAAAVGADS